MNTVVFLAAIRPAYWIALIVLPIMGCVQPSDSYLRPISRPAPLPSAAVQSNTINLEAADRIARFRRLAEMLGANPPQVDELLAPAGTVPGVSVPVPVVRLVFEERLFF